MRIIIDRMLRASSPDTICTILNRCWPRARPILPTRRCSSSAVRETFDIEAGRNVGPLTNILDVQSAAQFNSATPLKTGIETVGNLLDPTLPNQGASITVIFGIGAGAANASFAQTYLDPSKSLPGIPNFGSQLVSFHSSLPERPDCAGRGHGIGTRAHTGRGVRDLSKPACLPPANSRRASSVWDPQPDRA